jgi:hypothetical protein
MNRIRLETDVATGVHMREQSRPDAEDAGTLGAPNDASMKEKAEGSRENVNVGGSADDGARGSRQGGGITNRPLEQEQREQAELPPRGKAKEGGHA